MGLSDNPVEVLLVLGGVTFLLTMMAVLVMWARRRSVGVIAIGAFMSIFAPDPTLEQKIKLVEEAKEEQQEDDEQGELRL